MTTEEQFEKLLEKHADQILDYFPAGVVLGKRQERAVDNHFAVTKWVIINALRDLPRRDTVINGHDCQVVFDDDIEDYIQNIQGYNV